MNKIQEALTKLFDNYRVIFWYDEKKELQEQFNDLSFHDVHLIHVQDNQFRIKHQIEREQPHEKFLLYFTESRPANMDNWLLDMELANYVFQTNQEAMFAQEMGLDYSYIGLIEAHLEFFKSKERKSSLLDLLGDADDFHTLKYKMLAVLFNTDNISLIAYIQAHASAFNHRNDKYERELERFNLKSFYWREIGRKYNYQSDEASIYDFLIELFNANFVHGSESNISKESKILLSTWKDTISYQDSFRQLSSRIADDIHIESIINDVDIDSLLNEDIFELVDKRIISEVAKLITEENISVDRFQQIIPKRQNKYWYGDYAHYYQCMQSARLMISLIRKNERLKIDSFDEGIKQYTQSLYQIDYHYRKVILHYRKTNQNRVLQALVEKVEKVYGNDWLLHFGNEWQRCIDNLEKWDNTFEISQHRFFNDHVKPVVSKGQRLFVIISDAFRYEIAYEYFQNIQSENRFEAELSYMVSTLPSYTQLGMAALLPNKNLSFVEGTDQILIDGHSTAGMANRAKILKEYSGVRATAIQAEELMKMNSKKEGLEFVKGYDLIYVFHNRIDKVGDDKMSEDKVFEAAEQEVAFLIDMVKKIGNMSGNKMYITADHGFIYQHNELDESDFSTGSIKGDKWKESRRYVVGKDLDGGISTNHFQASKLNLIGDAEVLIPKSINRIRIKGSGARFVHGGATLQEIVIPLIKVAKTRQNTIKRVDIDIIKSTDKISTNILAVSFLQTNLVGEKILPRKIRSAIYADDGEALSDVFTYNFNVEEGIERQREVKHRFQLSSKASTKYKNQRVKLVLEEPVEGANKWNVYKEYMYTLYVAQTNDFD